MKGSSLGGKNLKGRHGILPARADLVGEKCRRYVMKLFSLIIITVVFAVAAGFLPQNSWAGGVSVGIGIGIPAPVAVYPAPAHPAYYPAYVYGPPYAYGPGIVVAGGPYYRSGPYYRYYGPRHYGHYHKGRHCGR
jgi:hypothetical protein